MSEWRIGGVVRGCIVVVRWTWVLRGRRILAGDAEGAGMPRNCDACGVPGCDGGQELLGVEGVSAPL